MYVSIHTQTYMWCTYVNTMSPAGSFAHACAYAPTDALVFTYVSTCMFTYVYEADPYTHLSTPTHRGGLRPCEPCYFTKVNFL